MNYRNTEEEKLDNIPKEMEEFITLSIFDREKFDRIGTLSYEVTCVGEVSHSDAKKSVLRLHPKFSVIETLEDHTVDFEQELCYAKVRITINKELKEENDGEELSSNSGTLKTVEEEERELEEEAKSRLTFDPTTKTYNDHKPRVTDLDECSRVTLPKSLPTKHKTLIEMRRGIHGKLYKDHKSDHCNKKGFFFFELLLVPTIQYFYGFY